MEFDLAYWMCQPFVDVAGISSGLGSRPNPEEMQQLLFRSLSACRTIFGEMAPSSSWFTIKEAIRSVPASY